MLKNVVSSISPMMEKTQVNSDCEFYDIYTIFSLQSVGPTKLLFVCLFGA